MAKAAKLTGQLRDQTKADIGCSIASVKLVGIITLDQSGHAGWRMAIAGALRLGVIHVLATDRFTAIRLRVKLRLCLVVMNPATASGPRRPGSGL